MFFVVEALFSTVTNVNFDPERLAEIARRAAQSRDAARKCTRPLALRRAKTPEILQGPAAWMPASSIDGLVRQGQEVAISKRREQNGDDVAGLQELLTYGVKGTAAYADHAMVLGREDDGVYAYFHEALDFLAGNNTVVADLLGMNLKCGEVNFKVMEMLDAANTGAYGHPVPTPVRIEPVKGKAILVSGHDLKDLALLLSKPRAKASTFILTAKCFQAMAIRS